MPFPSSFPHSFLFFCFGLWPFLHFDQHSVVWLAVFLSWLWNYLTLEIGYQKNGFYGPLYQSTGMGMGVCRASYFIFYMYFLICILSCIMLTFWRTNKHNLLIKYVLLPAPCISHQLWHCVCSDSRRIQGFGVSRIHGFMDSWHHGYSWCLCSLSELMSMNDIKWHRSFGSADCQEIGASTGINPKLSAENAKEFKVGDLLLKARVHWPFRLTPFDQRLSSCIINCQFTALPSIFLPYISQKPKHF